MPANGERRHSSRRWHAASVVLLLLLLVSVGHRASAQQRNSRPFHVVVLAERGGLHAPFVRAAKVWLQGEAQRDHFTVQYLENTNQVNAELLSHCQLFIQLNYPPYNWTGIAKQAFENYIDRGEGGWIGFHHASLLGQFDGFSIWPWYSDFMGGIRWTNYIPTFATATVHVEEPQHPILRGVATSFTVKDEEWYTWSKSPRRQVDVLASVDESTYTPDSSIKMGDHPVIWSNAKKPARNVYFFMGHHPELLDDKNFTLMFHNAILWAANTR